VASDHDKGRGGKRWAWEKKKIAGLVKSNKRAAETGKGKGGVHTELGFAGGGENKKISNLWKGAAPAAAQDEEKQEKNVGRMKIKGGKPGDCETEVSRSIVQEKADSENGPTERVRVWGGGTGGGWKNRKNHRAKTSSWKK